MPQPHNLAGASQEIMCDCLGREDVSVITANPKTAGVARWNFLALWGHRLKQGDAAALDYVRKVDPPFCRESVDQERAPALLTAVQLLRNPQAQGG